MLFLHWFHNVIDQSLFFSGHHYHCLHCRREPHGPGLLQYDVQSNAHDVPEPLPEQLLTDGRSGRLPHLQPVSVPLLLCGPTGGLELFLYIVIHKSLFDVTLQGLLVDHLANLTYHDFKLTKPVDGWALNFYFTLEVINNLNIEIKGICFCQNCG